MIAAFAVIALLSSCGGESSSTPPPDSGASYNPSPNSIAQFDLNGLTINTIVDPGYPAATVVVSNNSTPCAAKSLTEYSEFALSNSDTCGSFTLNLQYVPASSPCQPGGLYLI
jgi:hypothetical protein